MVMDIIVPVVNVSNLTGPLVLVYLIRLLVVFPYSMLYLQEQALKTFHISDDPKNYYVAEASEFGKSHGLLSRPPFIPLMFSCLHPCSD